MTPRGWQINPGQYLACLCALFSFVLLAALDAQQTEADLSVAKAVSNPTPNVGDTITFTITLTNSGPLTATNVTVTDLLPAGLMVVSANPSQGSYTTATGVWTVGTITIGAPRTLSILAMVVGTNTMSNTATISHSDQFDPVTSNNAATVSVTPQQADLSVLKAVSNPTPNVGDTITFTITLTNSGPLTATNVTVTDLLPAGLTFVVATPSQGTYAPTTGVWTVGTITTGAPRTLSILATVVGARTMSNTAAISHSDQFDPNTANNTATVTATPQQADLSVLKAVSNPTPNVGDTITFTIALTNSGPLAATNVTVTDLLPAGLTFVLTTASTYDPTTGVWTVGTITTGGPQTLSILATVVGTNTMSNTAAISHSDQFDPNTANNTATVTVTQVSNPNVSAETEPNDTAGMADTIVVTGQAAIVSGSINPGGDVDFYTFVAAPGSRIWIETDTGGTQNAGATSRDTVIDLLAADGTTVIENDDDDGTGNGGDGTIETSFASLIAGRMLVTGGTYYIRVRAYSPTDIINPYRLLVAMTTSAATAEVESNDTAATANLLVASSGAIGLRSGSIGAAGDVDYYSVVAAAGNVIYFSADADPERDGTGTDLVVELRNPADVLLLSVDSSITGSLANPAAEGANFSVMTAGTYFIKVRHFSAGGTGTYHIMATAVNGSSPAPGLRPAVFVATATGATSVSLAWSPSVGATSYEVFRQGPGAAFASIGTFSSSPITDAAVAANTAYLYKVRVASPTVSSFTNPDLATTVMFTNPVLTPNVSLVSAIDFVELRAAVNAVRVLSGAGAFTFTDTLTAGSTSISALHIQQLRSILDTARSALSLSPVVYTHPTITAGTNLISVSDVIDLRRGVD